MKPLPVPAVPVSWGELLDKIAILEIKRARIRLPEARANVEKEYRLLRALGATALQQAGIAPLYEGLRQVNEALWEIEDAIREEEAGTRFGEEFIRLARSVYLRNDERASIKRRINTLLASELTEEKSYASFAAVTPPSPAIMSVPAH